MGVDYLEVVVGGEIVNVDEYGEMVEFSVCICDGLATLDAAFVVVEQL